MVIMIKVVSIRIGNGFVIECTFVFNQNIVTFAKRFVQVLVVFITLYEISSYLMEIEEIQSN